MDIKLIHNIIAQLLWIFLEVYPLFVKVTVHRLPRKT